MIDLTFTDHEKRILSNIGQGAYGRELTDLMGKLKARVCSLEGLEDDADHNAEVKARLLFKKFAEALIEYLQIEPKRGPRPMDRDDFT